jgi:hypothetical protein
MSAGTGAFHLKAAEALELSFVAEVINNGT